LALQKIKNSRYFYIPVILTVFLFFIIGCSTKKNTGLTRTYHNLTAYYNVYFNGKEALKSGLKKIDDNYKENYSLILPVFKFSKKEAVTVAFSDMNRVIEKGSKCVRKHSIKVKPKRKNNKKKDKAYKKFYNKKEFVKWIDDAYLLIGKGHFYKHDYYPAIETFNYVVKEYSNDPIKYEGYLWLSRTYTLMKKYDKALDFLSKLETDKNKVPESLSAPTAATHADILLQQQQYEDAIPFLEKAIKNTKKKKDKVRYQYILAQLYQETKDFKKAYIAYGKVVDMNPDYEMTFNARINRASIFNSSANDSKELQRELYKMLKDDKNYDYRDQIYYALGNIAFKESREDDAVKLYLKSAQVSTQNENQKAVSYLAAADIFFDYPNYKKAEMYYDSALVSLSIEYPGYVKIKNKSENLNELVKNIEIINKQDSLQKIAKMNDAERNAIIDKIIANVIEQERLEQEQEAQRRQELMYLQQQNQENKNSSGEWYFYNQSMLSMGQAEFKKKWSNRKNEDNWRRKNKQSVNWGSSNEETASEDTTKNIYSNKTREYYLVDLPLTDSAMQVSKKMVEDAYFDMAIIYKEKFNDFKLSINGFLNLLKRYPETKHKLSAYYNLYKLYYLTKNYTEAEKYKNLIINNYPNSDYAKVLSDPDYFRRLEKIEKQVTFMYHATYKYFLNDKCEEVYHNYKFVDSAYHDSKLIPKFALLATLCSGHSGDTAAFKDSLKNFKVLYSGTNEAKYADEVLAALDRKPRKVILEKEKSFGGELAENTNIDSIDFSMYKFNPQSTHYYIVVVNNEKADAKKILFNLNNFNLDYYSFLDFDVKSELISANYTVIEIEKFKNKNMASNYFESIKVVGDIFTGYNSDSYREFIISQENYNTLIESKKLIRYQHFFNKYYK
jgi:tetratricopeptide (TPR) repeat protein